MDDDKKDYIREDKEDPNSKIHKIHDISVLANVIRVDGIKVFNAKIKEQCSVIGGISLISHTSLSKDPQQWPEPVLEKIISIFEVIKVIEETLTRDEDGAYNISARLAMTCVDKVSNAIFYTIANSLVDQGIFEMFFDSEKMDFGWRITKKFEEQFGKMQAEAEQEEKEEKDGA